MIWTPNISVAEFKFNKKFPYENYEEFGFKLDIRETFKDEMSYYLENAKRGLSICVTPENCIVEIITCTKDFFYKNQNLLKLEERKFLETLKPVIPDSMDCLKIGDEDQRTLEFDQLGLMAWVNEAGCIVRIDTFSD